MPKYVTKKIAIPDISYIQYAVFALCLMIVGFLFTYAYFVNATVHSVVNREHMEEKIGSLHSSVSELESQYFARIEDINMRLAQESGFEEISQSRVHFAQRITAGREVAQAE